jgi:DnaD/phage-associated family protein
VGIMRIQKNDNFVVMDKRFLNDVNLSWQAKGMLSYMLSLPNDWEFHINDLKNRSSNGRDSTNGIIKELAQAGYITKNQTRDNGKFGKNDFTVHETKQPFTENPSTGKPSTENPTLLNNKELNNKFTKTTTASYGFADEYFKTFGKYPSAIQLQELGEYLDEGFTDDMLCYALQKTARAGGNYLYCVGILKSWYRKQIYTLEQALEEENQFQNKKVKQNEKSTGNHGEKRDDLYW